MLAGTGVAAYDGDAVWWKAALALVVSLALQVGVNYANDYSDGIRGTDADRVGPMRLVGSGVATPASVKRAAFLAFGVAGVAGLALAATTAWWLVLVGAVSVVAAWFYTGGSRPYGYLGLGEVMVFVFFGLVAVLGTPYVQTETLTLAGVLRRVRHRRARLRDPRRQQPARHPDRPARRQDDSRRPARRPGHPRLLHDPGGRRAGVRGPGRDRHHVVGVARPGVPGSRRRVPWRSSGGRRAATWCRPCS